jgi:hypothetical protein
MFRVVHQFTMFIPQLHNHKNTLVPEIIVTETVRRIRESYGNNIYFIRKWSWLPEIFNKFAYMVLPEHV